MKLFDISLGNSVEGAEQLFAEGKNAENGCIRLQAGERVSFGTYFNLLSEKYITYCGIDNATLELDAEGSYRLDFFARFHGGVQPIKSAICSGKCAQSVALSAHKGGGYVYFEVTALGDCTLHGGAWTTEKQPERHSKIAVVICTYRREEYVLANIARVAAAMEKHPERRQRLHLFIVDNAHTLNAGSSDFYTIIPNRNLGGSGGFARGMYEAVKDDSFTHILIMDDDISFDFGTLERTYYLLDALTAEYSRAAIGGAMLINDQPYMQYEFGGQFDGLIFRSLNTNLDVRLEENLLKNENAPVPNYNAWWYCCMPASFVREYGLPMPFFIKGDDVEYGLRTAKQFILMNGIAVWHQNFLSKYTGTLEYYIKRNGAACAALRMPTGGFKAAIRFAYFMFKNLSLRNYECVELIYRAYRDFKEGPSFFLTADSADLNDEIRSHAQAFALPQEVEKVYGGIPKPAEADPAKRHSIAAAVMMFFENYMPGFMFSDKVGVTNAGLPRARDCFMKKTVIHYDVNSGKGLILHLDTKRRRKLRRLTFRVFFGLLFNYRKIRRNYLENWQKMCSAENWERMFFKQED